MVLECVQLQGESSLDQCACEWRGGGRWMWRAPTASSSRSRRPRPRCATFTARSGIPTLQSSCSEYFEVFLTSCICQAGPRKTEDRALENVLQEAKTSPTRCNFYSKSKSLNVSTFVSAWKSWQVRRGWWLGRSIVSLSSGKNHPQVQVSF